MKALYELVKQTLQDDYQFLSSTDGADLYTDPVTGGAPVKLITCKPSHFSGDAFTIDFIIVQFERTKFMITAKNRLDEIIGCEVFRRISTHQNIFESSVRSFIDQVINRHQNTGITFDHSAKHHQERLAQEKAKQREEERGDEQEEEKEEGKEEGKKTVSVFEEATLYKNYLNSVPKDCKPSSNTNPHDVNSEMPPFSDEYEITHKLAGAKPVFEVNSKPGIPNYYGDEDLYPMGVKNILNDKLTSPLQLPNLRSSESPVMDKKQGNASNEGFLHSSHNGGMAFDPLREMKERENQQGRPDGSNYPGIRFEDPYGRGSSNGNNPQGSFNMFGNGFM